MSKQILRGFVRLSGLLRSWLEAADQQNGLQPGLDFKEIANYIIISLNGAAALYIFSRDRTILDQTIRQLRFHINWSRPEGGMFIWAEGPEGSDMEALYWKAVEKKVAYVPEKDLKAFQEMWALMVWVMLKMQVVPRTNIQSCSPAAHQLIALKNQSCGQGDEAAD